MGKPRGAASRGPKAAGIIATACAAFVLGACGSPVPSSPSEAASSSAPPSATSDSSAARSLPPDDAVLIGGRAYVVIVDAIDVRTDPSSTAQSVGTLHRGDIVVFDGLQPVEAEGFLWHYGRQATSVGPGIPPPLPAPIADPAAEFPLTGYFVVGKGDSLQVAPLPARCPSDATFANVTGMLGWERVTCFGSSSLIFQGTLTCGPCGGDTLVAEPAWLADQPAGAISDVGVGGSGHIGLFLPPPLVLPPPGTEVRVIGHFDDPRAAACTLQDGSSVVAAEIATQLCREHFVVDTLDALPQPSPNHLE